MKVNLGSGLTVADGWVNVDSSLNTLASRLPTILMRIPYRLSNAHRWYTLTEYVELLSTHRFVHHDLAYGIPVADGAARVVYTAHCVEHLDRSVAEMVFREAHRVLEPGGVLRVNVPSFKQVVEDYLAGDIEKAIDAVFERDGGWYSQHRYLYDYALMERLLRGAGFAKVVELEPRQGSVPDLDVLEPVHPGRDRHLFVEAEK